MSKRYLDIGDRIVLAKAAMEFASINSMKPVQLYYSMAEAVSDEPESEKKDE